MVSFQMATYILKRHSMTSQAVLFMILLVVCFVKQCDALNSTAADTSSSASDSASNATTDAITVASTETPTTTTTPLTTTTKAPPGGNCTSNDTCSTSICLNSICKCHDTEYSNNGTCINKIDFGNSCNDTFQCVDTTDCILNDGDVCGCNDTHFSDDNVTCQLKPSHMESCNHTIANVCLNPATQCIQETNDTYYCLCNSESFWNSNTCLPTSDLKVTTLNSTSTENSITISWNPVQYVKSTDYYNISYETSNTPTKFYSNTATINSLTAGRYYNFTITTVLEASGLYKERKNSTSKTVRTKVSYGGTCSNGTDCVEGLTCTTDKINVPRCLCNGTEYRGSNGVCLQIQTVKNMSPIRETTTLSFTWDPINPNASNIEYYIYANEIKIKAGPGSGSVSDLSPGSPYIILVATTITADETYKEKTINSTANTFWTTPAQPGQVTKVTLLENTNYSYNVFFVPSNGTVEKYSITVRESPSSILEQQNTTVTNATFKKLTPGNTYTYMIIAISGADEESESMTGILSTNATESNPVSELKVPVDTITTNSALVTWQKPSNANGKIAGYVAFLERNSNCVAAYKITCNESLTNITNECSVHTWVVVSSYTCQQFNDTTFTVQLNLTNLEPYKTYKVKVAAINEKGKGMEKPYDFQTKVGAPNTVTNIRLLPTSVSNSIGFNLTWTPGNETGPTNYIICLEEKVSLKGDNYNLRSCNNTNDYNNTSYKFYGLVGFWFYRVQITAVTEAGNVTSGYETNQTLPSVPGSPTFDWKQDEKIANYILITITCPEERNRSGIIEEYKIEYKVSNSDNPQYIPVKVSNCDQPIETSLTNVSVERNYSVQVRSINQNYTGEPSNPKIIEVAPKPPLPGIINQSIAKDSSSPALNELGVLVCPKCINDNRQGTVKLTGLIVCVGTASKPCTFNTLNSKRKRSAVDYMRYSNFSTWSAARKEGFTIEYRATPDTWLSESGTDNFTYKIGNTKSCNTESKDYCNGPLPEDKKIGVMVFVCNTGGCQYSYIYGVTKAPDASDVPAIVGGVVGGILGLALIAAVVGVFIWWYKRRPQRAHASSPFWDMDSESRKREHIKEQRPVKIYEFKDHVVRLHKDSNLLFQDEFEDIKKLSARFTHASEKAKEESNRVKNRYVDILPYDHSRVKLDIQPEDDDSMDFINANFIPGYNSVREYIATQGPMHYTIPDFWRMTWEQKSKVIVMLSDLQEQGKRKVDLYWPENLNEPINYGNIIVEMTNFSQLNKYIIRNFKISRGSETRKVTHFFLPGWWDFSANLTTEDVLEFAKLVRQEATPANSGPIIVHCSAGVGRTGTFIALDYFMQYIDKHSLMDSVDIFSYVMKMRYNRPRMVQAETQYIFIFDALEEIISKKIKDEEEKMAEHTYGNGNIYANVSVKQPEESIYANSEPVKDKNVYDNQAFEMDYQNMDLTQSKKDNPTTVL